ncbi:FAD-binding oxidoreductase [Shimia ponticola]|uniref:FAD-binding oxidoreductase n=1 Tax=Shimia ponticola TaxID=2582893 RepID=UPI0011BE5364|nr:FAD-linked oxidase C-terminal domain-containing protein [Shimia ponticola]
MQNAQAIAALTSLLGDRVTTSKSDRDLHGRSETHFPDFPPDAVVYPTTTEDVSRIVEICAEHDCPVIGWGTGTSLEGHTAAIRGGITVDFSRMDQVLAVYPEDMIAVVQPGVTREALNTELRATGLFFPVDPGANASLGGMAATRASGTTAVRYGTMRDQVMGLEVVMADGQVMQTGSRARKSSAGYDLTGLMVGSEGTLGLITELTLKLHPVAEATAAAVCAFPSAQEAVQTVIETIQMGVPMARIEFLDAASIAAVNAHSGRDDAEQPHLFIEFHGSESAVAEQAEIFGSIAAEHGGADFAWSSRSEDRSALWAARHAAYYAILQSRPGAKAVVTDVCVPISQLATAIDETIEDIAQSGLRGPILGHVGDGNFHAILLIEPGNEAEKSAALALSERMVARAQAMHGTATGEHGVGMGKLDYMAAEHGAGWAVMAQIKRAMDPKNILNPGKVIRQN